MSIFREIPPTAGLPFYLKDLTPIIFPGKQGNLEDSLKEILRVNNVHITYSGTAAFYIILKTLKKISAKKTIIIPSFICPLIPLAINKAGLNTLVCDIETDSFNFKTEELERLCLNNKDILGIVPVHLGGIPVNLSRIESFARDKGIFIIEDCAQSFGASYQGKETGTRGDFAFYSLCRGKGVTIYEGGALVGKPEFFGLIKDTAEEIEESKPLSELLKLTELFGYWIFYRPSLFWFAFRLPQEFWKMQNKPERAHIEYFTASFPLHRVSERRKIAGYMQIKRLKKEIENQRKKADYYIERLKGLMYLRIIRESPGDYSNYPYLTLIFDNPERRDRALAALEYSGMGISRIYLGAITEYAYLKGLYSPLSCPNAQAIAKRHLTLSTSTFLKKSEQDYIINILRNLE